jgi:hypothetical protein
LKINNNWAVDMTEQDAWTLMAAYTNNNALYFLGNILAV